MDKRSRDLQTMIDAKRRRGGRGGRRRALDAAQRIDVKEEYATDPDASCRSLAEKHGVSAATIWRIIKAAVVVLLLSVNAACGWPPPPETVSIDPAFSALERAAILDGIDQWCQSVEWCPRVVARGAEGRYVLDESVLDGITSVVDGKPIVKLAPHALVANGGENDLWRVAVHETGHFGAEHNDRGIMAAVATMPYDGPLCLDDAAVQLWCAAQGCAHTKGTCR